MKSRAEGFTLTELMIVVAVIAIIAAIAVPNLLRARVTANEAAAVSTLKAIATSEAQCQAAAVIDTNNNGMGEFGFLAELAGEAGVRVNESGGTGTAKVMPPFLSASFSKLQGSRGLRGGYLFQLFLPDAAAAPVAEAVGGGGGGCSVSATFSEMVWSCYAWPANRGSSGRRAFFVNQSGEILACHNVSAGYSGSTVGPSGTAAALGTVTSADMTSTIAANATGQDGEFWFVVN